MKIKKVSPNLLRFLLGLYVLASVGYWLSMTLDHWSVVFHPDRHVQAPFTYDNDTCVISSLQPEAAAKVPQGATLESLNGVPYSARVWDEIVNTAHPDDMMDVGFHRSDGSGGTATITFVPRKPFLTGIPTFVLSLQEVLLSCVALGCLLMGFWVVIAKPTDGNAWLLLILLTFPSVLFVAHHGFATGLLALLLESWFQIMQFAAAPALLLFGISFPERSRWDVKFPWVKWVILVPLFVCAVILAPLIYGEYYGAGNGPLLVRVSSWAMRATNFLDLICLLLSLVLTLDKLRSASTEDARRRLRVLTTGMSIGLSALLLVFVILPHFGVMTGAKKGNLWIAYTGALTFLFAPFSLVYVALVQRAMDVRILLRMGARYALAKATLWAVQYILLAVVAIELLLPVLGKKQTQLSDLMGPLIFFGLIILLRMGLHKRIQHWLDRRFFREAYDAERVLNELAEEVRRYTETGPLLETVARCVAETLHVDQIAMLLRRGEYFVLQQSIGIAGGGTLTLPVQSSSVRYLTNSNEPARLYREDPDAWYLMAGTAERFALDKMNAELLLPLPGRNRMMGVMALGPKRSEAAYSSADLKLLQALASQTGLALEVSELARSLAAEAAQRERTNREMEIAREVQERLFPQEMPELSGAKISGFCRPALGVGGDYYDVIDIGDGRVGLAIGDVSGKGISAALLMASLRASLRGVTLDSPRDFAKLMHQVNRLVYEASASNRYATFFFASYDPATRRLECVNAGHNPPVVLRGQETIRLEADGPVVGLLPFAPYTEQTMILEPGDLLILYTDGISEAMTRDDEEWGEERMIAAARASINKPADEVLDDLFVAADAFTAGAPQHDDMTLLLLKLES